MKKINFNDIDYSLKYDGYYWYSNKQKPEDPFFNDTISNNIFTSLPFIIEGNFWCAEKGISINIKNIDGAYHIYQADLNDLPKGQYSEQEYIAHDLKRVSKIKILQYWEEGQPDELLAGMTTLIPAWQAFKGFIN